MNFFFLNYEKFISVCETPITQCLSVRKRKWISMTDALSFMFVGVITLSTNLCFNVCLLGLQGNSAGGNFDLFVTLMVSSSLDSVQRHVKTHNGKHDAGSFIFF